MPEDIIQLVQYSTWAGVAALIVWMVIGPWTRFVIERLSPKTGNGKIVTEDKLDSNHLHEIRSDIKELKVDISKIKDEQINQGKEIVWLKAKINGR